jgi:NifQ.
MSKTYQRLMACPGRGDAFDRHVFACILAKGASEAPRPLTEAVGLSLAELEDLFARMFPGAEDMLEGQPEDCGRDAPEEPDLRDLLGGNATSGGSRDALLLAAMVARRSLQPNHLWQDMGLTGRGDLSGLLNRHFGPLAARNTRDMKWKKFFYRQMCESEGLSICKSPVCEECSDFTICYGPEK